VELQLRIAAGEALPFTQEQVKLHGHAIEARVVAEDVLSGWVPSSGRVEAFSFPPLVRLDTWITPGTTVSPYYDSLLAKVIAFGGTRAEATRRMGEALCRADVVGVHHNVDLLLSCVQHPAFIAGDLHTGFLDEHGIVDEVGSLPDEVLAAAAAYEFVSPWLRMDPWRGPAAWRLGRTDQPGAIVRAGRQYTARVANRLDGSGLDVSIGSRRLVVRALANNRVSVDGAVAAVFCTPLRCDVKWQGRRYRLQPARPLRIEDTLADRGVTAGAGRLTAPMPGRIVKIAVQEGQQVRSNQPLVVLEAMKMEHVVEAPHAGLIQKVCVEVGQQVASGAVLVELGDVE